MTLIFEIFCPTTAPIRAFDDLSGPCSTRSNSIFVSKFRRRMKATCRAAIRFRPFEFYIPFYT